MSMPLTTTTADAKIADLKRTLEFVNHQNSALIEDRNSWRRVCERLGGENIDLLQRIQELEDLADNCEAHIVMNDADGSYFREHFNLHRFPETYKPKQRRKNTTKV